MKTAVCFATMLVACVSPPPESQTPTITATSVEGSPVAANTDGSYTFMVSFTFSDDVTVESYMFVAGGATITQALATPRNTGTTKFTVMLGAGTPSGTLDYTVTITDAMSRTSDDGQGMVVLSPP
jgi:hypothetical protein